MVVFLVQGMDYDDLINLADKVLDTSDGKPFMIGTTGSLEIECFDSEMGKTYKGASAMAMLLEYRKKSRKHNDSL